MLANAGQGTFAHVTIAQALAPLVNLIYPPRCPLCGGAIAEQTGLCVPCWRQLVIPAEPSCVRCQMPFFEDTAERGNTCGECRKKPPLHDGIAAGTMYNDAARDLVLAFKRGRKIALAPMLARLMAARLGELPGDWLVVPVPLHRRRLWERGFNQSALLARELARLTGARLLVDGLVRTKSTPSLGNLGAVQRRMVLKDAIAVDRRRAKALAGAQIVLVDDVLTSGATSDACINALKAAGAVKVRIACFSRREQQNARQQPQA